MLVVVALLSVLACTANGHTLKPEEVMPFFHIVPAHRPVPPTIVSGPSFAGVRQEPTTVQVMVNVTTVEIAQPFGDPVEVRWTPRTVPPSSPAGDFIAVWCGVRANSTDWLDTIPVSPGASGVVFRLFDMRCPYEIEYVDGASHAVLGSATVTYASQGRPTQLRAGPLPEGDPGVSISFTTHPSAVDGSVTVTDTVLGTSFTSATTVSTYASTDLCGAPASTVAQRHFRDPGLFHTAVFSGLPRGRSFAYTAKTRTAGGEIFSAKGKFTTAPSHGDNTTILFAADVGTHGYPVFWSSPGASLTQTRLAEDVANGASLVLHPGDVSYAVGHGYLWDQFMSGIEPISSNAVYAVSIGNHEYDFEGVDGHWTPSWGNMGNDSFGECGVPTFSRFPVTPDPFRSPWYHLTWGGAKIVMISSEHDWLPGSPQYTWLNATLASTDRTEHPWLLVASHRPMYMSQTISPPNHQTERVMRKALDPLINAHGVDLFLAGHWHAAERTCPVQDEVCFGEGERTVHYTAGTGGCCLFTGYPFPAPWDRAHFIEFSYLRMHVSASELNVKLVSSVSGDILDDYTLNR